MSPPKRTNRGCVLLERTPILFNKELTMLISLLLFVGFNIFLCIKYTILTHKLEKMTSDYDSAMTSLTSLHFDLRMRKRKEEALIQELSKMGCPYDYLAKFDDHWISPAKQGPFSRENPCPTECFRTDDDKTDCWKSYIALKLHKSHKEGWQC